MLRCILYDKFSQIPEVRWTSMASLNPEMGQLVQTFYPQIMGFIQLFGTAYLKKVHKQKMAL